MIHDKDEAMRVAERLLAESSRTEYRWEGVLCSECFDRMGCTRIMGIRTLSMCGVCGRPCLGYRTEGPAERRDANPDPAEPAR